MTTTNNAPPVTTDAVEPTYQWGVRHHGCEPDWDDLVWDPEIKRNERVPHTEETARASFRNEHGGCNADLVRRVPPGGPVEVVPYGQKQLSPLTAEMLPTERYGGLDLCYLGEDSDYVIALGHRHPADMAQAATLCLRDPAGHANLWNVTVRPGHVRHVYAVRHEYWAGEEPDDWALRWGTLDEQPLPSGTPGAVPITLVAVHEVDLL